MVVTASITTTVAARLNLVAPTVVAAIIIAATAVDTAHGAGSNDPVHVGRAAATSIDIDGGIARSCVPLVRYSRMKSIVGSA